MHGWLERRGLRLGWLACLLAAACSADVTPLRIDRHAASEASARLNAYLVQGEREAILVDATMTLDDAQAVAAMVERSGKELRTIFITNSQPDKYLGLPVLVERFPEARVLATPEVVADIEARGPGYLERLGRRYGDRIAARLVVPEAFAGDALELEGRRIEIHRFTGGECPHGAALFLPDERALLPGAIVFEGSHLFLRERDIPGWRAHLAWIRDHGGIDRIYPGHGSPAGLDVLDAMSRYLDDFEAAVAMGNREAALRYMTGRYPDYALERLLREYSVPAYLAEH
ncbi:MAG: MBL fold metallo-hydrolase [Myxococcota bacterium]